MRHRWLKVALGLGAAGLAPLACKTLGGYAEGRSALSAPGTPGVLHLLFDDFHSLNTDTLKTNAVSWKLAGAALVGYRNAQGDRWPETEDGFQDLLLHRYGFLRPRELANWPLHDAPPAFAKPLGLVSAVVSRDLPTVRIEAVNQGCATCHAAHLYDAQGNPHNSLGGIIGRPSASRESRQRSRSEYEAALLDDLERLGLAPDEPAISAFRAGATRFRQSDNGSAYSAALDRLRADGLVYACSCTRTTS